MGAEQVAVPNYATRGPVRRARQRERWFKRGQEWRTGAEGRISVLKRRHGRRRRRYPGIDGTHRWVGLGVSADNLINTGPAWRLAPRHEGLRPGLRGDHLPNPRIGVPKPALRPKQPGPPSENAFLRRKVADPRHLPTDHDHAAPIRAYQSDPPFHLPPRPV